MPASKESAASGAIEDIAGMLSYRKWEIVRESFKSKCPTSRGGGAFAFVGA